FLSSSAGRDISLADVAYTLQIGREAMQERGVFLVRDIPALVAKLRHFAAGERTIDGCWVGRANRNGEALSFLDGDADSRGMLVDWMAQGKYEQIAELWISGCGLDWRMLDGEGHAGARRPRRISLPTYPFAKEHYWPTPLRADPDTTPAVVRAISTPLPIEDTRVAIFSPKAALL